MKYWRRLGPLFVMVIVPWTVLLSRGLTIDLVFAWGLVNPATGHMTSLVAYLFSLTSGLPQYLLAWPTATLLYVLSLVYAVASSLLGREDDRVTVGLLVLAGLSQLVFTLGVARGNPTVIAVPVGSIGLWSLAWWRWSVR